MTHRSFWHGGSYVPQPSSFDVALSGQQTIAVFSSREEYASTGFFIKETIPLDAAVRLSFGVGIGNETPLLLRDKGGNGKKGSGDGSSNKSAPTDITLTSSAVDETSVGGTLIGYLDAVDSDRKDTFSFRLLDDADSRFAIDGNRLVVAEGATFDYDTSPFHPVAIEVEDKFGLTYSETINISVIASDDGSTGQAPTDIDLSNSQVATGTSNGELVGILSASDPDGDAPFSYQLIDSAGGRFAVEGDTLVVADAALIGTDPGTTYSVIVEVADQAGNRYSEAMTIEVIDPVDPALTPVPEYVLDALLPDGASDTAMRWNWDAPLGAPVTITYSFLDAVPDYYASTAAERRDFAPLSADQRAAVHDALAIIAQFTNVTFVEATDAIGDLAFGTADLTQGTGWAYPPGTSPLAGDVWLDNQIAANADLTPGGDGFYTLLHEVGHALGMKHPFEGLALPDDELNRKFTVMAYSEHPLTGGGEPTGYMVYDIAALQHLYGTNTAATEGDNSYDISDADGMVTAIWDAGGWDVLDASGSTRAVLLDLNQGAFSTAGTVYGWYPVQDNIAIAYGTVIEEARGGDGDDVIVGNAADNRLSGGAGADTFVLHEGWGSDLVTDFQDGLDRLDFSAVSAGFADLELAETDGSTTIALGADMLTLFGVPLAAIDESDFIFAPTV